MSTLTITFENHVKPALSVAKISPIEQKAFWKCLSPDATKCVYVSKTKRRVTRVDISGFTLDHPAVRPPAKKNGKVTGQVDMGHPLAHQAIAQAIATLVNGEVVGSKAAPSTDSSSDE